MIFDQLKAFHTVVKNGGFERAAESLHLSQPAISIRVRQLEKQLGVELFDRLGRRARLTDAGRIVEDHTARLMIVLSEMSLAIAEIKGSRRGQLRCGAATTIAVHLVPKTLVRFKRRFPNVEVDIMVGRTADIERRMLDGELDVGLIAGTVSNSSTLKAFHFLTDEFVLITPSGHSLAKQRSVSLRQIANLPLILREKGSAPRRIIDESFRAAGIPYHCVMQIETAEALKKAVAEGLGCSIASRCSIQTEIKAGILAYSRIARTPMKREFRVILHKDKNVSGPLRSFLDTLKIKVTTPEPLSKSGQKI